MNSKSHILALLGASSLSLSAQMTYQGPLTDNTGAPLTGPQTISFELFATPAGGTSAWQELKQVETIDGRFSVTLGADGSINAPPQRPSISPTHNWKQRPSQPQTTDSRFTPGSRVRIGKRPRAAGNQTLCHARYRQ